jgi:hypothetical protein
VLSHRDRFGSVDCLNPKLTGGFRPITAFTLAALSGTSLTKKNIACEKCKFAHFLTTKA